MADEGLQLRIIRAQERIGALLLANRGGHCRDFVRAFNRGGVQGTANLFAHRSTPAIPQGVSKLSLDLTEQPHSLTISEGGASAAARYDCTVELAEELEGQATIVQMARLQGNAASSSACATMARPKPVPRKGGSSRI